MNNERFNKRIKLTQDIFSKITKIDELKGLWHGGLRISPQILGRLKSWVIITSTGASTRIEGSKMTDAEIARFLRAIKESAPKNRDEQEVAGYADLIGRIFDNYKTLKLSENWILQFHEILLNFSDKDQSHRGKYKTGNNTVVMITPEGKQVVLFDPTPPYLVRPEMESILTWTSEHLGSGDVHPLLVISNFIFEFLAIHPFKDGNGRVSRALTNLLLLKSGYEYIPYVSLDEIIEDTRSEYYLALRATQKHHKSDHEDITLWTEYLLDALLKQAVRAKKLMDAEQPEKLLSEKQFQVFQLFHEKEEFGVARIESELGNTIQRSTIKQVLSRLVDLQLLERTGAGRGTRYRKL